MLNKNTHRLTVHAACSSLIKDFWDKNPVITMWDSWLFTNITNCFLIPYTIHCAIQAQVRIASISTHFEEILGQMAIEFTQTRYATHVFLSLYISELPQGVAA